MKKIVTLFFIIITLVISKQMVFTKSFTPPAARTGAPGESTCSSGCHEGASGTGGTIDFGGSLTEYELSKTYTVTITGESGAKNGFELVSLRDSDNTNIGTITVTNTTNTTTQLSGGKTYISHKSASSNNSWSFDWISPSTNEGNITFYFAVNKANGDGTFDGDLIYTNSLTITPNVVPPCSTNMFIISTSNTNILCNGNADGTASVSITGGTQPYSYKWSNGKTSQKTDSLLAGNYFITVTDANGCDTVSATTLIEPSAIAVKMVASSDASCGNNDGKISVSAYGGTPGFIYNWEMGSNDSSVTGLVAGSYTLTVYDANGCKWINSYNISDVGAPEAFVVKKVNISCNGYSDGSITISVNGGTLPYTYIWSDVNAQTTLTATGLIADIYNIVVTDSIGCKSIKAITLLEPDTINVFINDKQTITCNGLSDGSITVSADGGIAPYTYLWSDVNSQTTLTATGLSADVYNIEVVDSNGCKSIKAITLTESDKLVVTIENKQNITCYGDNDGAVDISVSGGTIPYSYLWSDGSTTQALSFLSPDKYEVTVTDANGCVDSNKVTISEPDSLLIELFLVKLTKSSSSTLEFAIVTGGITPYTYLWSNGDTTDSLYSVYTYPITLTVTDANGCIKFKTDSFIGGFLEYIENSFYVYPNPTNGVIHFGNNSNTIVKKIVVYNILGNVTGNKDSEIKNLFDLNEFNIPPGLYFIEIESSKGIIRKKIIFTK